MPSFSSILPGFVLCLLAAGAQAAAVKTFSPQGQVAQVRQVRAAFSEPMIKFGDPKAAAPFDISCSAPGNGRWADDHNWVYDFEMDLGPGQSCTFAARAGLKSLAGSDLSGTQRFQFQTGGPILSQLQPSEGSNIDPQQAFILTPNGAIAEASLLQNMYCEVEGIHERVPVKLVTGKDRDQLLEKYVHGPGKAWSKVVQCQQTLGLGRKMMLVWGKGISTPNKVATTEAVSYKFQVRQAVSADFSCERENAEAACSPLGEWQLRFSQPVPRKLAEQIVLRTPDGKRKPNLSASEDKEEVTMVGFKPPFSGLADNTLEIPDDLVDIHGVALANRKDFPMKIKSAGLPPLAKFATAPFGILELNADPAMPLTVRNVESNLLTRQLQPRVAPHASSQASLAKVRVQQDADIIKWIAKLDQYHESTVSQGKTPVESRRVGLLGKQSGVEKVALPGGDGKLRQFEVLGIPFKDPGFYVMEVESTVLGESLLGEKAPMFVRTSALVTNLSVHLKVGRENGMVWVTTLDKAKPVADAAVQISDCAGRVLWQGKTGSDGIAVTPALPPECETKRSREGEHINGYFVSARKQDEKGRQDMAFALSTWNRGLESYRFNFPTEHQRDSTLRMHTVFDRSLFRAGETVSMKHMIRAQTMHGFALAKAGQLPTRVRIVHEGSGQEFQQTLNWRERRAAETVFQIPKEAKLGVYDVVLDSGEASGAQQSEGGEGEGGEGGPRYYGGGVVTGGFRVEEIRLPVLQGKIIPPAGTLVAPKELPLNLQLTYLNGGGAAGVAVQVSSLLRNRSLNFSGYDGFTFNPRPESADQESHEEQKIIADKQAVVLDKGGAGKTVIKSVPAITEPQEIVTEMTFADPNGEIQTVSSKSAVWPSGVVLGLAADNWVSVKNKLVLRGVALGTDGKPLAGVALEIVGKLKETVSHRKRMVGGFYSYENEHNEKDLGSLCSGKSDKFGLFRCEVEVKQFGNIELQIKGKDDKGNPAQAFTSVWTTQHDELWFDGENQDRIDILAEKNTYSAGETAVFQVRMPFRYATALVAVEREGVIDTQVVELAGSDPTVRVPVKAGYGPNVYVSVLAIRGRLREVPWYSFFTWGWKEPINWWHEFRTYQEPTALIDLAKPAYKYGIAEIKVDSGVHQLAVQVKTDKSSYPIRGTARVDVQVMLPNGKPAAGAEVALAVVDEALLELQSNVSWKVLEAMIQRRSYGIETATAQMQVVGKRHFGRKAVPAGGGGGKSATRELFDTLLLWQPAIKLDAQGRATVNVPLNDALTSFRVVAVAESGADQFGTGSTTLRTTQDLQLISGLPPLVREGDQFQAMVTLRNTTKRALQVVLNAKVAGLEQAPPPQTLNLPADSATQAQWSITVPANASDRGQLQWEIAASEQGGSVRDALKVAQRVVPAVPVTVQQATLLQLDKATSIKLAPPADSLPGRGGVTLNFSAQLSGQLNNQGSGFSGSGPGGSVAGVSSASGLRRFFETYPYSCLEQKTSKAVGLHDEVQWQKVAADLPSYMDSDGLVYYYPLGSNPNARGSDILTSYLLAVTHEAGFSIPEASRSKMLAALAAFVEGKITRDFWAPKKDIEVRKLAAIEALARYGEARPLMLDSIKLTPNQWPTAAVLNWYSILLRMNEWPERDKRLAETGQILRARLNFQGTRMGFSNEADDYWWWLMDHGDANALRLVLLTMDQPGWRDDAPRMMLGAIGRQQRAAWGSTVSNAWAVLALNKFSAKFEAEKVQGSTRAQAGGSSQSVTWGSNPGAQLRLPWPTAADPALQLAHEGKGKPWVTVQSTAAIPLTAPFGSGYRIKKTVEMIEQKQPGQYSVGDIMRIKIEVTAQADMSWVVLTDPLPAGASLLGSGLGRDSAIASQDEKKDGNAVLAYEERSFEAFRGYYEYVAKGVFSTSYTIRLNNAGQFNLPQTRVEAMYAPEMFGESPNAKVSVK